MDHVLVSVVARCAASGDQPERKITLEDRMPLPPILSAKTLQEAMTHFQSYVDCTEELLEIHSFKVDGRELINTFIDS